MINRQFAISAVVMFIMAYAIGFLVHGMLLQADYAKLGNLMRPMAEMKTLSTISREMKELAARARVKKLALGEYQGGASAISNLGMYGVREFSAIINPPHATILAVGAARRQAVEAENSAVQFVSVMSVTLSCDHRVVDGALGAELIAAFKGLVEQPVSMLV